MAYATNAQVASEFKSITFSSSSTVTNTEVDRFIDEADAEINSVISGKYVVPIVQVDSPESFKIVRMISIWLVADRVRQIMQVKPISFSNVEQGTRPSNSAAAARKLLEKIRTGGIELDDAELASINQGFRSFSIDDDLEHTFKKGVDQW